MTRRRDNEDAVQVARRYRTEAIACLVATIRNERAPASARANAAGRLLEYADDKAEPIKVADLHAVTDDEREELFVALLQDCNFTSEYFASGMKLAVKAARIELQRQREQHQHQVRRHRPRLPHRTPTSKVTADKAAPGPADAENAPDATSDARGAEHALPGPALPPQGTPDHGPRPLIAGPGEAIVDAPQRMIVNLPDRVHLLRPGQVVPLDVAEHPLIAKFVVEEYPDNAA
jgi:hypothetical protein